MLVDRLGALSERHAGSTVVEDLQRLLAKVGSSPSDTVSVASGMKLAKRSHSRLSAADRDDASPGGLGKLRSERSLVDRSDDLRSAADGRAPEEMLVGDGMISLSELGGAPREGTSAEKSGKAVMLPPRRSVDQATASAMDADTVGMLESRRDASAVLDKSVSTSDLKLDETLTPAQIRAAIRMVAASSTSVQRADTPSAENFGTARHYSFGVA